MTITETLKQPASARAFWLGFAAYVVPSFAIGYTWHLVFFAPMYHDLAIYRDDIIIPFGLLAIFIQGTVFSWVYPRVFTDRNPVLKNGLLYGLGMALLSWSFTTLAVGAKHVMASVPTYLALETAFTVVQFAVAGPLIALAHRK